MSHSGEGPEIKSMRHRQILDLAAEHPDASLDELASMVPSATTELVENLLEKHGDPADEAVDSSTSDGHDSSNSGDADESRDDGEDDSMTDSGTGQPGSDAGGTAEYPSAENLSAKERETLRLIAEQPDATQAEVAEQLGVSAPTVSNRVNSLDGFDWAQREAFVTAVLEPESMATDEVTADGGTTSPDGSTSSDESLSQEKPPSSDASTSSADLDALDDRLSGLEERLDTIEETTGEPDSAFEDPELLHKVVHACFESETITEEEELRIIQSIMR